MIVENWAVVSCWKSIHTHAHPLYRFKGLSSKDPKDYSLQDVNQHLSQMYKYSGSMEGTPMICAR